MRLILCFGAIWAHIRKVHNFASLTQKGTVWQAEELLARKRAQLEEASRLRAAVAQHNYGEGASGHSAADVSSESAAAAGGGSGSSVDTAEQDRLKRAEIFRQV